MPEPLLHGRRYMPGLDGLRAFAVLAVIVYHLGFSWASGGLLGVAVFFTLSGYLITDLLLAQYAAGTLLLRDFWLARARRLLPALFVMLAVVSIWVWADDRAQLGVVRGQVVSGLFYVGNWWQSFQHVSYFARFGPPSPLNHLWSLAIEEQFYIVWPWLLLAGIWLVLRASGGLRAGGRSGAIGTGPWHGGRPLAFSVRARLAALSLILACGSALEMWLIFRPGFDPTRVYTGTDTRAFGLLFGAALACLWPSASLRPRVGRGASWVIDAVGLGGLIGVTALILTTTEYAPFIYHGGLVLASVFTVMAVAALSHPASRLARALGCKPLRWLGVRSYAIYLWHAPVIALTTPNSSVGGVQPLRALLQVAASVVLAALSWRYVENPVRHGALSRAWTRLKAPRPLVGERAPSPHSGRVAMAATTLSAVALFAGLSLTGAIASPPLTPVVALAAVQQDGGAGSAPVPSDGSNAHPGNANLAAGARPPAGESRANANGRADGQHPSGGPPRRTTAGGRSSPTVPKHPHTSCESVVHIGDSTSEGLTSNNYLPDPHQQIPGQYRRVGVKHPIMEITGGTSIIETLPGTVNARTVARNLIHNGYHGCWVIALGTNDVADVYVGSNISLAQRIKEMMAIIGRQPVMWVNVKTLVSSGPYAESNMLAWNHALVDTCRAHPNVRVYNWAGAARDKWFIPDGIHYYSDGYAARAHLIANALAEAFPRKGPPSHSCVVSTPSLAIPVLGIGH